MPKKNPIALAMVKARNKKLSPERRKEIARNAAKVRWANKKSIEIISDNLVKNFKKNLPDKIVIQKL